MPALFWASCLKALYDDQDFGCMGLRFCRQIYRHGSECRGTYMHMCTCTIYGIYRYCHLAIYTYLLQTYNLHIYTYICNTHIVITYNIYIYICIYVHTYYTYVQACFSP